MNLSLVLTPVANAEAAGAESAITESAMKVLTAPTRMESNESGWPLNQRAKVYCSSEHPSAIKTITFFALSPATAAEQISSAVTSTAKKNRTLLPIQSKIVLAISYPFRFFTNSSLSFALARPG